VLEGIEAIMFRTIGDRPSAWESRLPGEVLRLPGELARVDALLDDPVFFAPFAPFFHPVPGRPPAPAECCLRLMFLKFRYRLGYASLCAGVSDSISWRRFCRIPLDGKVPHPAALMKLTTRVRDRGRAAGRRAHAIAAKLRSRAAQARDEKQAVAGRMTGELASLAGAPPRTPGGCWPMRAGRCAGPGRRPRPGPRRACGTPPRDGGGAGCAARSMTWPGC
jgi:transposase, IS5 family